MSSFNITMSLKFQFSISLGKHRHPSHWELFLGSGFFFEDFTEKNIVAILISIISSPGMSPGEELWGHFNAINDQQQVFYDDEECHLQIKKSGHIPRTVGRLPQEGRRGPCNGKGEVWFHFSLDSLVWLFQGRSESRRQLCLKELVEEGDRDHNHVLSFAGGFVFLGNILPRLNGNWIRCSVSDMTVKIQDEKQTQSWFMFIQNSGIYWSRAISRVRKVVYSDLRGGKMGQRPGSVAMHGEIFMMVWWWPWWWNGNQATWREDHVFNMVAQSYMKSKNRNMGFHRIWYVVSHFPLQTKLFG